MVDHEVEILVEHIILVQDDLQLNEIQEGLFDMVILEVIIILLEIMVQVEVELEKLELIEGDLEQLEMVEMVYNYLYQVQLLIMEVEDEDELQ